LYENSRPFIRIRYVGIFDVVKFVYNIFHLE
jgi:hypothetical protein